MCWVVGGEDIYPDRMRDLVNNGMISNYILHSALVLIHRDLTRGSWDLGYGPPPLPDAPLASAVYIMGWALFSYLAKASGVTRAPDGLAPPRKTHSRWFPEVSEASVVDAMPPTDNMRTCW